MTDVVTTTAPLDEVRGLVDERGRYEGWLSALDARRAVTPAHVLDRVRQDYDARLRRVLDALEAHAGALRADERALSDRHDEQMRLLGERRDLLAEVELRTLVGEFAPDEGERQRREVEGAIGELEGGVAAAAARLGDVRQLLGRVHREPAPPAPEPAGAPAAIAPEPPAVGAAPAGGGQDFDGARAALGDTDAAAFQPGHFAPGLRTPAAPSFTGQGFADAASGFGVPAGAAAAQEKTLRCADCGAMNYPTEWYCEKCGGELATL
jgi:hypothetical protein